MSVSALGKQRQARSGLAFSSFALANGHMAHGLAQNRSGRVSMLVGGLPGALRLEVFQGHTKGQNRAYAFLRVLV